MVVFEISVLNKECCFGVLGNEVCGVVDFELFVFWGVELLSGRVV